MVFLWPLCTSSLKLYFPVEWNYYDNNYSMTSFVYEVFPVQEVNGLACGNAFGKNHLDVLSSNQNIMYLLTEWEGRMGKYLAWGHGIRTKHQICSLTLLILTKKVGIYVATKLFQFATWDIRAIRNPSRARQLFPALLAPAWCAFLNSFAIKGCMGPYGSYNKGLYLISCDFIDDIVIPTVTGSQTIYS